jgi:regulator of replication initiation timing
MYSPTNQLQFQNNLQMPGTTVFRFPDELSQDSLDPNLQAKKRKSEGMILEPTDTRRDSHNIAEKRRRDKINEKIEELSMLISNNPSKSNKASILGNTVEHIQALDARYQELLERNRLLKMENVQLKQAHAKLISSFPHIEPSVALQNHSDGIAVPQSDHDLFLFQQHQLQQHLQGSEALHVDGSYDLAQEKAQLMGVGQDGVQSHEQLPFMQFPSSAQQQYQQFSHNPHQYSSLQNGQGSFQLPSSFHSLAQFPPHLQHQFVSMHEQQEEEEQVEDHAQQIDQQALESHQLAVVMQHHQHQQEHQDEPRLVQEYQ